MITGIIDPVLRYLFCSPKLVIYYGLKINTLNIFVSDEDAVAVVVLAWWGAKEERDLCNNKSTWRVLWLACHESAWKGHVQRALSTSLRRIGSSHQWLLDFTTNCGCQRRRNCVSDLKNGNVESSNRISLLVLSKDVLKLPISLFAKLNFVFLVF